VLGTSAAGLFHLTAKRLPGSMQADRGIICCDSRLLRQIAQFAFLQINEAQRIPISRFECTEKAGDTLADLLPHFRIGLLALRELPSPDFHGFSGDSAATVVIDDRIPQDSIEPRHDFFVRHTGPTFQATGKCRL
jgi:hypothetical protein